jgi:hypothetical protein
MKRFLHWVLFLSIVLNYPTQLLGQTYETFNAGSYIINMGVVPQTVGNALRPYGLIYALTTERKIPVKWIIDPIKHRFQMLILYIMEFPTNMDRI